MVKLTKSEIFEKTIITAIDSINLRRLMAIMPDELINDFSDVLMASQRRRFFYFRGKQIPVNSIVHAGNQGSILIISTEEAQKIFTEYNPINLDELNKLIETKLGITEFAAYDTVIQTAINRKADVSSVAGKLDKVDFDQYSQVINQVVDSKVNSNIFEDFVEGVNGSFSQLQNKINHKADASSVAGKLDKVDFDQYSQVINQVVDSKVNSNIFEDFVEGVNGSFSQLQNKINHKVDASSVAGKLDKVDFELLKDKVSDKFTSVKEYGAVGDGVTDDTLSFVECLKNELNVFIPAGSYIINETLLIRNKHRIKGVGRDSILINNKENSTLLLGNKHKNANSGFQFVILSDFFIKGSSERNQIGLEVDGFQSQINNVVAQQFDIGVNLAGVTIDLYDVYISNCNYAINIFDTTKPFNTMLNLNRCNLMYNTLGLNNVSLGQKQNNVIDMNIINTVFEYNKTSFDLDLFGAVISGCWFEGSTNKPKLRKWKVFMFNNRFEQENDRIEYKEGSSKLYRGATIVGDNGDLDLKSIKMQRYSNKGVDVGTTVLTEGFNKKPYLNISYNETDINAVETTNNTRWNKHTRFTISPSGTVTKNGDSGLLINVSKLSTGVYLIKFDAPINIMYNINVASPQSQGSMVDKKVYSCGVASGNTITPSNYNDFNICDHLIVKGYSHSLDNEVNVSDVYIHVDIVHE